jgi:hypothetical protein
VNVALVYTPESIAAFQAETHQSVLNLNDDIAAHSARINAVAPRFISSWRRFRDAWTAYYSEQSGWTRLWGSTLDDAERYARILQGWREQFQEVTGSRATGPAASTDPDPHRQDTLDTFDTVATLAMVGAGVGIVYFITKAIR